MCLRLVSEECSYHSFNHSCLPTLLEFEKTRIPKYQMSQLNYNNLEIRNASIPTYAPRVTEVSEFLFEMEQQTFEILELDTRIRNVRT